MRVVRVYGFMMMVRNPYYVSNMTETNNHTIHTFHIFYTCFWYEILLNFYVLLSKEVRQEKCAAELHYDVNIILEIMRSNPTAIQCCNNLCIFQVIILLFLIFETLLNRNKYHFLRKLHFTFSGSVNLWKLY